MRLEWITSGMDLVDTNAFVGKWFRGIVVACFLALAACATPQASDPRGTWRPVHQFADAPQAIPLQRAYVFQAFPSDRTLKALLTRWSGDAGIGLSYLHGNDYTLHAPVAQLRTTSIEQAAAALSAAYASQGVRVSAERGVLVVSQAAAMTASEPSAAAHGISD